MQLCRVIASTASWREQLSKPAIYTCSKHYTEATERDVEFHNPKDLIIEIIINFGFVFKEITISKFLFPETELS